MRLDHGIGMLDGLSKDFRYAARSLGRTPAFTITALLMLALGIGATTAIFSLVNAVMLRTLPIASPEQLVFVGARNPLQPDAGVMLLSNPPWLRRIRQETNVFSGVAGYNIRDFKVQGAQGTEQVVGQYATGNFHALAGVPMAIGRGFATEDDFAPGTSPIAVISHGYWQRRYGGNPDAIGRPLTVGGHTVTIVGVTARGFEGLQPGRSIDITLPLSIRAQDEPDFLEDIGSWTGMPLVARLRPGITASAAEPMVHAAYVEHMMQPGIGVGRDRNRQFVLTAALVPAARGADRLRREYTPALAVLMAIVGAVLLIACVNVANLFLSRGATRTNEVAMRLAIGASRWRIARQLLAEAGLVAAAGGAIGFFAAGWATRYISALLSESQRPIALDAQPDLRVLAFTASATILTTLLFGLAPALRATRTAPSLRVTASATVTARRPLGRLTLISAQLAVCVVLVFWAGLLVQTLRNLEADDPRFASEDVLAFGIDAVDTSFPLETLPALCDGALARLREPGTIAGSCSVMTPLDTAREVRVLGIPEMPSGSRDILENAVSPDYFRVFGIDLTRGRLLTEADTAAAPRVAVINEAAARHFFGDADPVGRQIAFSSKPEPGSEITVVGVVADTRHFVREAPQPMSYQPLSQFDDPPEYLAAAIRTTGDLSPIAARVRRVVSEQGSGPAVAWIRSLRQQLDAVLVTERLLASFSTAFGALALLLAAIGVYGVISYDVAGRTREIGVRMALGAEQRAVLVTVLRQVAFVVVPGLGAGLVIALLVSRVLEAPLLYGVTTRDPGILTVAASVLAVTALAAACLPARRAARVNPSVALRAE